MKAIYIGAGDDTRPIKRLSDVAEFVHVDSQPYSEFGILQSQQIMSNGSNGYSRPRFFNHLCQCMKDANMMLKTIDQNVIDFVEEDVVKEGGRKVRYYINTAVPEHIECLKKDISTADMLIVAGHDPHISILDFTTKKLLFTGFSDTSFAEDEFPDKSTVMYHLHHPKHAAATRDKFSTFTYVSPDSIKTFDTWEEFVACSCL
jgi:hypothetical protein